MISRRKFVKTATAGTLLSTSASASACPTALFAYRPSEIDKRLMMTDVESILAAYNGRRFDRIIARRGDYLNLSVLGKRSSEEDLGQCEAILADMYGKFGRVRDALTLGNVLIRPESAVVIAAVRTERYPEDPDEMCVVHNSDPYLYFQIDFRASTTKRHPRLERRLYGLTVAQAFSLDT